jgi:hypothetical protein
MMFKEIMKAAVGKLSGGKADVREFLNVRYGLGELSSRGNPKLLLGWFHLTSAILVLLPILLFAASFVVVALWIQLLNMREIWLHPNFSRAVSVVVIAFVLSTNFALFGMAWLKQGIQPFQTLEDFETLKKLEWKDKDRYTEILKELAERYARKGYISKLLFRTRMRRIR